MLTSCPDEGLKDAVIATANVHYTFPSCLSLSSKLCRQSYYMGRRSSWLIHADTAQVVRCPTPMRDVICRWCFEMVSLGTTLGLNPSPSSSFKIGTSGKVTPQFPGRGQVLRCQYSHSLQAKPCARTPGKAVAAGRRKHIILTCK